MEFKAARLAILALAKPWRQSKPIVVAVGTRDGDTAWHAAILDPDALGAYLGAAPCKEHAAETLFDLDPPATFDEWLARAGEPVGISDGAGLEVRNRIDGKAIWIDRIARAHFYAAGTRFEARQGLPLPLAWLDTAATAIDEAHDGVELLAPWVVSRLRLDAEQDWPVDGSAPALQQKLTGFRFVGHVPMAVNPQAIDGTDSAGAKRYDSRLILCAHAVYAKQNGQLWSPDPIAGIPAERLSARFNGITIGFSNANGVSWLDGGAAKDPPTSSIRGLHSLVSTNGARLDDPTVGAESFAPIFGHFDGFSAAPPATASNVSREASFRSLDRRDGGAEALVLRGQVNLRVAERGGWKPLWNAIVQPVNGQPINDDHCLKISSAATTDTFQVAQEQRLDAAVTRLDLPRNLDWLVTARFEQSERRSARRSIEQIVTRCARAGIDTDDALRRLRPGTGMTIAADVIWSTEGQNLPWEIVASFTTAEPKRRIRLNDNPAAGDWKQNVRATGQRLDCRSLQPAAQDDPWKPASPASISIPTLLDLTAITLADGTRLGEGVAGALQAAGDPGDQPDTDVQGIRYQVSTTASPWTNTAALCVAGIEFGLSSGNLVQTVTCERPQPDEISGWETRVTMTLPVKGARPLVQSDLAEQGTGIQRDVAQAAGAGLIFPVGKADAETEFTLEATEHVGGERDQKVEWNLSGTKQEGDSDAKLIVIDPAPFRIAAVEPLRPDPDDTAHAIASCVIADDGVPAWRIVDRSETVRLMLPPQVMGEAMEKSRSDRSDRPQDIDPGRPAAMRFGSLTRISVDPTDRDTNTHEPGWNLRRLFNRVADKAPGAIVRDLRFEIAYGLLVGHKPERLTRLSELAGIIGAPRRAHDFAEKAPFTDRVKLLLQLESSRIAVDKLWQDDPASEFETEAGLRFALRRRTADGRGPATPFRFPAPSGYPAAGPTDAAVRATFADPSDPTANAASFPGGIPWAFDSANILRECYADPASATGRIGGIHFSALGGWGRQRAAFAKGKSIIETETAMGRMSFYKLERLGRIGGLHNRAKHVVVYRRTVAPSAQFFNVAPIGRKQDEHAGRPILRKVEEYVDILQPERRYPEDGATTAEAGCLSGARFVSRRIRVDSDWGGDVRNEGWMVPLWSRDFALAPGAKPPGDPDSPANLYPKPLVQLLMPGEDGDEVPIDIDTPERLAFYTSTLPSEKGDLVDSWHAVEGIDFCDAPAPVARETAGRERAWPAGEDLHDGMLPPAPHAAGGHDRLTLGLVDSRAPVRIGARRVVDSAAAVLRNVSISRARPLAADQPGAKAGAQLTQASADLRGDIDRLFGLVTARFESLARDLLDPRRVIDGRAAAKKMVDDARADLKGRLRTIHDRLQRLETPAFDLAAVQQQLFGELRQAAKAESVRLLGRVDAALALGRAALAEDAEALATRWLADLDALSGKLRQLKSGDAIAAVREQTDHALGGARTLVDRAAADATAEICAAFDAIHTNIAAVRRAMPAAADIEPIVKDAQAAIASLQQATNEFGAKVRAWIGDADITAEQVRQALRDHVAQARAQLRSALAASDRAATAKGIPKLLAAKVKVATDALRIVVGQVDGLAAKLADVAWPGPNVQAALTDLTALVDQSVAAGAAVLGALDDTVTQAAGGATDLLGALQKKFDELVREKLNIAEWEEPLDKTIGAAAAAIKLALADALTACEELLKPEVQTASDAIVAGAHKAADLIDGVHDQIENIAREAQAGLAAAEAAVRKSVGTIKELEANIDGALKSLGDYATNLETSLEDGAAMVTGRLQQALTGGLDWYADAEQAIGAQIDRFADALIVAIDEAFDAGEGALDRVRREIERAVAEQAQAIGGRVEDFVNGAADEFARQIGVRPGDVVAGAQAAVDQAKYLYQEGDNVLRLIRAIGDPPKGDALGFNRPEVAYVFDLVKPVVDVTPVLALANRVANTAAATGQAAEAAGKLLESFGVRLPITGIGKDLLPDSLKDLSLSKLFPDMAGLDLEGLLKNAGFPDLSGKDSQGVKITRSFDAKAREAWMRAEIDVKLSKPAAILEFGPVALMLDSGRFSAETEMRLEASGTLRKEAKGRIAGDWRVVIGGMDIVTFEQTPLLFDKSGKVDFKIATDRVRLAPSLEFLTNLMAKLGKALPGGVEPVIRGGIPVGLVSRLQMALPPVATGAFAVTDLNLAASFAIVAVPEFEIAIGLDIASRDAPFTLAVWLLNGGGYISQRLSYLPMARPQPLLTYTLDVAICAGVGIGFGFGVVSGGVWLQIGCSVALTWTTGRGGNVTTVTAFLLARGNVDVAGLVTASIMLRLEISYDGSVMLARGTLRLSFRISMFYTLRVSQQCEYKLAGERRSGAAANDYSDSFG